MNIHLIAGSDRMIEDLARLAAEVDRFGIDRLDRGVLRELARLARRAKVPPEVVDLLDDREAPLVVRSRAFGAIARRLAQPGIGPTGVADRLVA